MMSYMPLYIPVCKFDCKLVRGIVMDLIIYITVDDTYNVENVCHYVFNTVQLSR